MGSVYCCDRDIVSGRPGTRRYTRMGIIANPRLFRCFVSSGELGFVLEIPSGGVGFCSCLTLLLVFELAVQCFVAVYAHGKLNK